MDVELRDLRWALVASRHRSLRKAAQTLNIRQSTLSRRLRDLEYRLGTELFERTNGGTHLTEIGREFLETARRIVEETDAAFSRLKAMSSGQAGRLTIGVYVSLATGNLRATLAEYHRRFPDVDVHTVDGAHDRLLCDMITSSVDAAIMTTCYPGWDDRKVPPLGRTGDRGFAGRASALGQVRSSVDRPRRPIAAGPATQDEARDAETACDEFGALLRRLTPAIPAARISRAIRFRPTERPSAFSSA